MNTSDWRRGRFSEATSIDARARDWSEVRLVLVQTLGRKTDVRGVLAKPSIRLLSDAMPPVACRMYYLAMFRIRADRSGTGHKKTKRRGETNGVGPKRNDVLVRSLGRWGPETEGSGCRVSAQRRVAARFPVCPARPGGGAARGRRLNQ
jgi:hypothetical protein